MSVTAPPDNHRKIAKAAGKAGVPYIMPNVHGIDIFNKSLRKEAFPGYSYYILDSILEVEKPSVSHIALVCGFWYEWSLALGENSFGFDIKNKKVLFYGDGKTRFNVSTWEQCDRALAALLSLP
jgi:hypothetical protein